MVDSPAPNNPIGASVFSEGNGTDSMDNTWEVIVKHSGNIQFIEGELGVDVEELGGGYAIITLRYEQIPLLYSYSEIEYVERSKRLTWGLGISLSRSCITQVQSATYSLGLRGAGTAVAIIDSGIDYAHPDFRNPDGTTRIHYLWDQTIDGAPPAGFKHGSVYTAEQINAALEAPDPFAVVPSRDTVGHGTAVAGIAAGNGRASDGRETGVAPESNLLVVRLGTRGLVSFARTTEFMRALKFVIDKAEALRLPVAVNISFGTNDGSHTGLSLFEAFINDQALRWKTVIVVATGNEGAAGHHFRGRVREGEVTDVAFSVTPALRSLFISAWKNFADTFSIEFISPGGQSTGIVRELDIKRTVDLEGVRVHVQHSQPTHYSADQGFYVWMQAQGERPIPQGLWKIRIHPERVVDGLFDIWLPTLEEVGSGTAFSQPINDITLTLPATAMGVISVGGYNAAIDAQVGFSGKGYIRGGGSVKPDLVAPALNIITTRPGGGYDSFTGSSLAAPFVTGSAALMMEWGIVRGNDPFLYGQRVKAFLTKGARHPVSGNYPDTYWGYGTLCLSDTMTYLHQLTQGGTALL